MVDIAETNHQRPSSARRRRWNTALWLPAILAALVFVRLNVDTTELSYDYAFYKRFVVVLSETSYRYFQEVSAENFPYYKVNITEGYFSFPLDFELGFAWMCYIMLQVMPAGLVLPAFATASIYLKIRTLQIFGLTILPLLGLFVFFIALLETNALRSGISQSISLICFLMAAKSGRLWSLLVAAPLAAAFHLSSLAVTLPLCGTWIYFSSLGLRIRTFRLAAIASFVIGLSFSTPWIASYFARADVYMGRASEGGLAIFKMLPLLSIALAAAGILCTERLIRVFRRDRRVVPGHIALAASCAVTVFIFGTALYMFNSLPVISARVWQLTVPFGFLPCALALRWRVLRRIERHLVLLIFFTISCAFVYQFMFRYVLTNFFSLIVGHQPLEMGQCASGLC